VVSIAWIDIQTYKTKRTAYLPLFLCRSTHICVVNFILMIQLPIQALEAMVL